MNRRLKGQVHRAVVKERYKGQVPWAGDSRADIMRQVQGAGMTGRYQFEWPDRKGRA